MTAIEDLRPRFDALYEASRAEPAPSLDIRRDRLRRLITMIREDEKGIIEAINADYGQRSKADTEMAEIFPTYTEVSHTLRHTRKWMRKRRVPTASYFWPGRSRIVPQPKGVVGIIAPWNYPLFLTAGPLAGALSAGNRVMLKPSEYTPHFSGWLAAAVARHFTPDEVTVVRGGPDIGAAFSALPFDHLFFTGNSEVGKKIMAAASANLTPVTLELGGKSPVILTENADLKRAVSRVMTGKMLNAGQTCVAPDYVLLPEAMMPEFIKASRNWISKHYKRFATNKDVSHIIDDRQFTRLTAMLDGAVAAGATAHDLSDAQRNGNSRLFPPIIVTGAPEDSDLMTNEVFGPILPVVPYSDLDQAIEQVKAGPRPLAAYFFSKDRKELDRLSAEIISGGACYNETLLHVAQNNLPFGGVGASGMGSYHGKQGFDTFSHLRGTFIQPKLNAMGLLAPPFKGRFRMMIRVLKRIVLPIGKG